SLCNLKPAAKFILLALAKHAHGDGTGAHPSLRRLQHLTGYSLAEICLVLPTLEQSGWITIAHKQGPKGSNLYTVHPPSAPLNRALGGGALDSGAPQAGDCSPGAPPGGTKL